MRKEKEGQRKLTEAEQARKLEFERTKEELFAKGYEEHDLTMGVVFANVMAIFLCIPLILPFLYAFALKNPNAPMGLSFRLASDSIGAGVLGLGLFFIGFILLISLHELIHGIFGALFAKEGWKSVSFGFIAKYLTPYCHCKEPLKNAQYLVVVLMPTLLLGVLPGLVAIFLGNSTLLNIGILMIFAGGGDLLITLKLLFFRSTAQEQLILDHPYQLGLAIFTR